ncbi:hypothetical protein RRG08_046278 [Elysia crispata]|uniref:Uncharacterized protein n=1 Tax=Elysia crispata TaxID=231223 RepID=A0AAE0YL02_9GAST|nr:hypothetical protein RRG08_046278 [Elysia crispata]
MQPDRGRDSAAVGFRSDSPVACHWLCRPEHACYPSRTQSGPVDSNIVFTMFSIVAEFHLKSFRSVFTEREPAHWLDQVSGLSLERACMWPCPPLD